MRYRQEDYSLELLGEMLPLWKSHYQEIAAFKDIPLNPDLKSYEAMVSAGVLRIFTLRDDDGSLHGYQVFFVKENLHYMSSRQAHQDILFLCEDFRQGMSGYKFIDWCDEQLRAEGVQAVYQHVKAAHDFTPLLKRLGYQMHDISMVRRLD